MAAQSVGTKASPRLALFRRRDFRLFYLARVASTIGDGFATVGIAFAVLESTGSPTSLGLVLFARALPYVLIVAAGGVLADRLPRRLVMASADLVCVATQGLLAVLVLTGTARLWHMMVLYAIYGAAQAFYRPAQQGLVPQTVDQESLPQANSLLAIGYSTGEIAGPALGGLVVAATAPGWGLAADAVSFAVGAVLLLAMRVPASRAAGHRSSIASDFVEGWGVVRARSWLSAGILYWSVFQVLTYGGILVLGPYVADRHLGGAAAWGTLLAGQGIGLVIGSALSLRYQPRRVLLGLWLIMAGLVTPVFVMLALSAPAPLVFAGFVLYGVSHAYAFVLWTAALQVHVPQDALSRVVGIDEMLSGALRPVGFAAFGPLAAWLGVTAVLLASGGIVAAGALAMLAIPGIALLRTAAEPAAKPPEPVPVDPLAETIDPSPAPTPVSDRTE
jgi:MFS family permease